MAIDLTSQDTRPRFRPQSPRTFFQRRQRSAYESGELRSERGALSIRNTERLSSALGWFSIGLGVAELVLPRTVSLFAGITERPLLMRACGLREIASGVGILTQRRQRAGWLWSRVAGDAIDLAVLGSDLGPRNRHRDRTMIATAAVAGVTLLDLYCSQRLSRVPTARAAEAPQRTARHAIPIETSVTINRSAEECYRFWRNLENLPRFMKHLESVRVLDERRSHWVARVPGGGTVEWDSDVTADVPNECIAWRSVGQSEVAHSGSVRFEAAPAGRGTIVRVSMQYAPPGGVFGSLAAKLFGEAPEQQIREDLRRFKNVMETGEIPTTRGQPSGRRSLIARAFTQRKESYEG